MQAMTKQHASKPEAEATYLCECAHQPFDECYCRKLNGKTVPNIVMYCMDRFTECPVYRRRVLHIENGIKPSRRT